MLDFLTIDRHVAEAARALDIRSLAGSREPADPIRRSVSTLDSARELEPFASDALAAALLRWVLHLTVVRVTAPDRDATLESFDAPADQTSTRTMAEHVDGLLRGGADRALAERVLPDSYAEVMDPSLRWLERTREAERRAGITALDARALAERVIEVLAPIDDEPMTWLEVVERGLSRARGEGWPAHLTPRTLTELVGRGWFEGLRFPPIRLPQPLGVSSFARALADMGTAFATHDRDTTKPFSLCRVPRDGLVHRRSALFGSLALSAPFHQRRFGVAAHVAREEVRAVARASVLWLRLAALRVLVQSELLTEHRAQAFEETTHRIFGRPWPGRLAAVVPRLVPDAAERLVGVLRGERDRRALRDRFEEDWFDNPRAVVWVRHENHQLTQDRPEPAVDVAEALLSVERIREILDA